ncbi:DUF3108 domain-containing protein [Pontiellaceae bacterium B12219]|nr:DUF3108 domain-containing protein [Pontiellaceae bacterium B12219]
MIKLLILFLVCSLSALAAEEIDYSDCFVPGEVSQYNVSWAHVPIGWSRSSTETTYEEGRELIRIRMETQTYATYKAFFKVDNVMFVVLDPKTALPLRLDRIQHQGDSHKSYLTTFDHAAGQAVSINRLNNTTNTVSITPHTREMLSLIYASRRVPIEQLPKETYSLLSNGELFNIQLKVKDTGNIRLSEYGKVASIELDPIADREGADLSDAKTTFWVSKKTRRMITCVETKVSIGKVRVKLESVTGPGDDFWIKERESKL